MSTMNTNTTESNVKEIYKISVLEQYLSIENEQEKVNFYDNLSNIEKKELLDELSKQKTSIITEKKVKIYALY